MKIRFQKRWLLVLILVLVLCLTGCDFGVSDEDTKRVTELTDQITAQLETLSYRVEADYTESVEAVQFLARVRQEMIDLNEEPELSLRIQGLEALQKEIQNYLDSTAE